jgi:hypothetical protein
MTKLIDNMTGIRTLLFTYCRRTSLQPVNHHEACNFLFFKNAFFLQQNPTKTKTYLVFGLIFIGVLNIGTLKINKLKLPS